MITLLKMWVSKEIFNINQSLLKPMEECEMSRILATLIKGFVIFLRIFCAFLRIYCAFFADFLRIFCAFFAHFIFSNFFCAFFQFFAHFLRNFCWHFCQVQGILLTFQAREIICAFLEILAILRILCNS